MAQIEDPSKARRLARAIASDISLYNEEKVREGLVADTFFDAMSAELEEGRQLYATRVAPALDPEGQHYWDAVVNIILRSKGHIETKLW